MKKHLLALAIIAGSGVASSGADDRRQALPTAEFGYYLVEETCGDCPALQAVAQAGFAGLGGLFGSAAGPFGTIALGALGAL